MSKKYKQAIVTALGAVHFTVMLYAFPQTIISDFLLRVLIAMCLFVLATRDLNYFALWLQTASRFVAKVTK